jgi:fatty acid-binding protein DegV
VRLLANSLHMTPIVRSVPGGEIKLVTCLIGRRNVPARFARYVAKQCRGERALIVALGHAVNPGDLSVVKATLQEILPAVQRMTEAELGTALGVHGGPGTLMIATQPWVNPADLAD